MPLPHPVLLWVVKSVVSCSKLRCVALRAQCCGGMGFLSINKIGPMSNDMNVDVTFEGDNTVMMQQVELVIVIHVR